MNGRASLPQEVLSVWPLVTGGSCGSCRCCCDFAAVTYAAAAAHDDGAAFAADAAATADECTGDVAIADG
jgi:hypothetical protein